MNVTINSNEMEKIDTECLGINRFDFDPVNDLRI